LIEEKSEGHQQRRSILTNPTNRSSQHESDLTLPCIYLLERSTIGLINWFFDKGTLLKRKNLLNLWRIEFVTISSERIISKEAASPEFEGNHTLSGIRIPLEEHSQLLDQFFFF